MAESVGSSGVVSSGESPSAATVLTIELPTVDATRDLGRALGGLLRAGDLLVLTGDLGAGRRR